MGQQCDDLQMQIDQHRRALSQPLDPLSKDRIGASLRALEQRKDAVHA